MNNKCLFSLICLTVLAFAPACKKQQPAPQKEEIKTMIELDNTVFETENTETENKQSVAKF
jgi:hypothetical protein